MSAAALRDYRRLVRRLLFERDLTGGELSQDEEAERADELDLHWRQMNAGERASIEEDLASNAFALPTTADAPKELLTGDVEVGNHTLPRKHA